MFILVLRLWVIQNTHIQQSVRTPTFHFLENRTMKTIEAVINKIQSAFNITLNVVEDDKTFTVHYNDQFVVLVDTPHA